MGGALGKGNSVDRGIGELLGKGFAGSGGVALVDHFAPPKDVGERIVGLDKRVNELGWRSLRLSGWWIRRWFYHFSRLFLNL